MRRLLLVVVVATFAVALAVGGERARERPVHRASGSGPPPLLEPGPLVRRAGRLGAGPRLIAGVRVNRAARVDMAGDRATGRTALVIGCLDAARCAGSALVMRRLYECPPVGLDLWLVPGLRGGVRGDGWRALRRLVSDSRPDVVVLYTSRGPAGVRAGAASAVAASAYARRARVPLTGAPAGAAGWVARMLPGAVVVEIALPEAPGPTASERHRRALRELVGILPVVDVGPAGA